MAALSGGARGPLPTLFPSEPPCLRHGPEVWQAVTNELVLSCWRCSRETAEGYFFGARVGVVMEGERREIGACRREQQFMVKLFDEIRRSDPRVIFLGVPFRGSDRRWPGIETVGSKAR